MKHLSVLVLAPLLYAIVDAQTTQQIFERAAAQLKAGDYAGAESGFRNVLKSEPRNVEAMGNLGVVYSRTFRYAPAIDTYKQALRLLPQEQGILLNLGLVYLEQDNYALALPY